MHSVRRAWTASGRFLWDFLGGDTPEVPITTAAVVLIAYTLHRHQVAAVVALPAIGIAGLSISVLRARRSTSRPY
jgi:hypothetical protein